MSAAAAARRATARNGRKLLLFGHQALDKSHTAHFTHFETQLTSGEHRWATDVIASLPQWWATFVAAFPQLRVLPGQQLLDSLVDWSRTGIRPHALDQLSNFALTPLVVLSELIQYDAYATQCQRVQREARETNECYHLPHTEAIGCCTGLLSAFAVAASQTPQDFRKHAAAAVRLALLIGAFVDAQNTASEDATSLTVSWRSAGDREQLDRILDAFPQAYISVLFDERRVTVTCPVSQATALQQQLRSVRLITAEIGLRGCFHAGHLHEDLGSLIAFCRTHEEFRLPDASQLAIPARGNGEPQQLRHGPLHSIAIHAILGDSCRWYDNFSAAVKPYIGQDDFVVLSFGRERCVPPSLTTSLGSNLIDVNDLDYATAHTTQKEDQLQNAASDGIAVVGMSIKVAGADDLDEYWQLLCAGKSQHAEIPKERFSLHTPWRDPDPERRWYGNFMDGHDTFDHKFFRKSPREMSSTDPQHRLLLQAAYRAVAQSGYFHGHHDKHIGCYMGVGIVDYERNIDCHPANAYTATGNLKSFAAGKVSHYFGWTGPSLTIDTACSSSAVAIHTACNAIKSGECTAALVGAATVMSSPDWFQNLAGASFLSPTGQCKPFDAKADGYCRGEGVGAVFLKSMKQARADGDRILGVIAGSAVYQNENCTPITVPNAPSLSTLLSSVSSKAGIDPHQVTYVEAHGTGTPVGDPAECEGIRKVFGGPDRLSTLSLGSVKGLVGHTEAASGLIALVKLLLMLHERSIPPQASFETLYPAIEPLAKDRMEITTKLKPWEADHRIAVINNYGASGSNASLVVTESPQFNPTPLVHRKSDGSKMPFRITGFDDSSLRRFATRLKGFISKSGKDINQTVKLQDLAYSIFRQSNHTLGRKLIFNAASLEELDATLSSFTDGRAAHLSMTVPEQRPIILCFGGQSSSFVGLDAGLCNRIHLLRHFLDECDRWCLSFGYQSIFPGIFQRSRINDIVQLQLMLFAIQYSSARCWIESGVQPAALVGHSFGELTALCVGGVLSLEHTIKLIANRARLIRDNWGPEKGSMIYVDGDINVINQVVEKASAMGDDGQKPVIACYNGPKSFTVAGSDEAINCFQQTCVDAPYLSSQIRTRRLDVSNAFHSPLVNALAEDLESCGTEITFSKPSIHIERATQAPLSCDNLTARYVADHLRGPVFFDHAVQRLSQRYPSAVWLEAGSRSGITSMANRALSTGEDASFYQAVDITSENSYDRLVDITTTLWKQGVNITFWAHHKLQAAEYNTLLIPSYQFEKSKHWLELKNPTALLSDGHSVENEAPVDRLFEFSGYKDEKQRSASFRINNKSEKFKNYIAGHKMAHTAPISSSSLQLDLVLEALMSIHPQYAKAHIYPQLDGLYNQAPMFIDDSRAVWLDVEATDTEKRNWDWKLMSHPESHSDSVTLHVSGTIIFRSAEDPRLQDEFERYQRLASHERCRALLNRSDTDDVIHGRHIYKTFAEIVDYGEPYRLLQRIVGKDFEAAARMKKVSASESWLDIPLWDCFCQVTGIFVNCMTENDPSKNVCMANKVDRWMRSPKLLLGGQRPETCDVLALHSRLSDKQYVSDIFVFNPDTGDLLDVVLGVSLTVVSRKGLCRTLAKLDPAAPRAANTDLDSLPHGTEGQIRPKITLTTDLPARTSTLSKSEQTKSDIPRKVKDLIADVAGLEPEELTENAPFAEIGIDSLMGMELAREIENVFKIKLSISQLYDAVDLKSLTTCIEGELGSEASGSTTAEEGEDVTSSESEEHSDGSVTPWSAIDTPPIPSSPAFRDIKTGDMDTKASHALTRSTNTESAEPEGQPDLCLPREAVLEAFSESKALTDYFISNNKFKNYTKEVLPMQDQLCIALAVEAFAKLGCNLAQIESGAILKKVPFLARHEKFVDRLYTMLDEIGNLIRWDGKQATRTATAVPNKSSATILEQLLHEAPDHANDHKLTYRCGSQLAECLKGETDGVQLIFGSVEGRELAASLYGESPINRVWLTQQEDILTRLVAKLPKDQGPLKIMEMGGGTGGATTGLAALCARLDVPIEYTFSDISGSLVAAARKRFKKYPFMKFRIHDIEKEPPAELLNSQHIVISNNCVHATHALIKSTKNIRNVLRPDGFLMLMEMSSLLYWIDMGFGALEGWWLFDDGRTHAVVQPTTWESNLRSAGYGHVDWTDGGLAEAKIQRNIIAMASSSEHEDTVSAPKLHLAHADNHESRRKTVDDYVRKYSAEFTKPMRNTSELESRTCVLITGASGSLGCHLVEHLANLPNVHSVVCMNRKMPVEAELRQRQSLESRGIHLTPEALAKIRVIETDTAKSRLGLTEEVYAELASEVTDIIHNAWPMSLKRPLKQFEGQMQALSNLIGLARTAAEAHPARVKIGFQFISSIATVGSHSLYSGNNVVPETRMGVESVLASGYGDAKLVCEHVVAATLNQCPETFRAMSVRLGQIAGSKTSGYWNSSEHLALLIKSCQTLDAVPDLHGTLSWYPVNDVAATLGDLLFSSFAPDPIYHIENPRRQPWEEVTRILADALRIPKSNIIPLSEWVERVQEFGDDEFTQNPAAKLVDFLEESFAHMSCGGVVLDTTKSQQHSKTLAESQEVDPQTIGRYVEAWRKVGFLRR